MQNIDSDLIRGNIDTIILKTMLNEDKYGLDIIKEVEQRSNGTYELKQPTLYSCLKRLENQELISSYWLDSDIGGKRHYYKLTDKGRDFYNKKQEEWARSKFIIDNLLSSFNYEEYRLVKKEEYDEMAKNGTLPKDYISDDNEISEPKETATTLSNESNNEEIEQTQDDTIEEETSQFDETEIIENSDNDEDSIINKINEISNNEKDFENLTDSYNDYDAELNNDDGEFSQTSFDLSENNDDYGLTIDESPESNDSYVYFSPSTDEAESEEETDEEDNFSNTPSVDQSSNELNILKMLRDQDDEEINTYQGDQKSYVNHLRQNNDDIVVEQQDLLDDSLYHSNSVVDSKINDFEEALNRLNNFDDSGTKTEPEEELESETLEPETEPDNFISTEDNEDDLDELDTLNKNYSNGFFNSYDDSDYQITKENEVLKETENGDYENELNSDITSSETFDFSSNLTTDYENVEDNNSYESETETTFSEPERIFETNYNDSFSTTSTTDYSVSQTSFDDIDSIVSNNISSNYDSTTSESLFTPIYNTNGYKEKLSNLSAYSKVTETVEEKQIENEDALEKAKDIGELTKELEEEGIKVRQHYKNSISKDLDKTYLLSNKIKLIKSLIVFFGYVFILSAVYIVLNNTTFKDNFGFSIKYFLIGFIPFACVFAYYLIKYLLNPYKKVPARYAPRIMIFISIIITVQLLLITYCINLQMGFYSFAQKGYNHLFWVIPMIVSFAPIVDNLVYMALFYSRNFNV